MQPLVRDDWRYLTLMQSKYLIECELSFLIGPFLFYLVPFSKFDVRLEYTISPSDSNLYRENN